jgi:hypothetical protein
MDSDHEKSCLGEVESVKGFRSIISKSNEESNEFHLVSWLINWSGSRIQSGWLSTLWKNSKSLAQGGYAQAHAFIFLSITCDQLVYNIGSPRIIEDQLPAYLGASSSSRLIRVYLLSWV